MSPQCWFGAPRGIFGVDCGLCPPESPGSCCKWLHNIRFPSQSDVLENNVFPRQQRVPDERKGSAGWAGCRFMFCRCPGPPALLLFGRQWCICKPQMSPSPGPPMATPRSSEPWPCRPLHGGPPPAPPLPEPAWGPWHDPSCGWGTSLLGRPPSPHVSPSCRTQVPQRG